MKKNKVLLLGYSHIARKRVIKTFLNNDIQFSVASRSYKEKIRGCHHQYSDYDDALSNADANIVYISLPNSLHFYWANKALKMGYHVIVDKPICCKLSETKKLIQAAKRHKKLLSEAIFYNFHNQVKQVKKLLKNNKLNSIKVKFIIPFPHKNSILMSNKFKGGVIMDMGPYASSIHRIFFNKKIVSSKIIIKKNKKGLPILFDIKFNYKEESYHGLFKFGGEYTNQVVFFTKNKILTINRVFSPPDDLSLNLNIIEKNKEKNFKILKDNCFENYFIELLRKINKKKYSFYLSQIKKDHLFRDNIQKKIKLI